MNRTTNSDLRATNIIAYDEKFRQAVEKSHELLGTDITDFYAQALDGKIERKDKALQILKNYSEATADLSLALMEAKEEKEVLSEAEQELFDRAKGGTVKLGQIQNLVNTMIKEMAKKEEHVRELMKASDELAEMIMETQEYLRMLRSDMNAYGYLSKNRDIADLYETNKKSELKSES